MLNHVDAVEQNTATNRAGAAGQETMPEIIANVGGWQIEPEILVEETFTDNLTLAPDGMERSDFVTIVTPGISISRLSRRLDLDFHYSLQNIFYKNNSEFDDNFHLLQADGTGELLEDYFFLDVSVRNSEQNVSRGGSLALDNISAPSRAGVDDRASVFTYSISPYWQQRVGNFMDIEARYEFDEIKTDRDSVAGRSFDSESETISFLATSGTRFTRFLWDFTYDDEEIENDFGNSAEFRTVFAGLEYLLTRKFALKAELGYDDNDFASADSDISGERWRLGAVWRPSTRTSLEALAGRRFFGTDVFIELRHRSRRTEWLLSYTQIPDLTRSNLRRAVFTNTDIFGAPIDPVTGQPALLDVTNAAQTDEVLIRERFRAAVSYTLRRNIFDLTFFHETRDFQLSTGDETAIGSEVSWTWLIGPTVTSDLSFIWNDSEFRNTEESEFFITQYQLKKTFSQTMEANLGFRRVDRSSNIATREYTENRIFINLFKVF